VNVLVIGDRGLVGRELRRALTRAKARSRGLDLEDGGDVRDPERLRAAAEAQRPTGGAGFDWVVNLAAMTAVDDCEAKRDEAFAVNAKGAGNAARIAAGLGARILQVSTDYVFDGKARTPYRETDPTNPLSVYGESKCKGEEFCRAAVQQPSRLLIVRGQSLYGEGTKSFPDAIVRKAGEGKPIPVVTDQTVSPTWARGFAEGLVALMRADASGLFHLSASGHCTWFEFAKEVLRAWDLDEALIVPTTAAALARPARRPAWSVFDLSKFQEAVPATIRDWKEHLHAYRESRRAA
jgi:dTDP-4-dehydrorhamnose reductase